MSAQGTRQAAQAPETLFDPTSNSQDSYVIALDQGTTSSRAVLVDRSGAIRAITQSPFPQIFPRPGWVEHDPKDILSSQLKVLTELLVSQGLSPEDIDSIGITNQRETTIVWNRHTGEPVHNAIVWQCRRTAEAIDELKQDETIVEEIRSRTGLIPDAYFSASKIAWIPDNVEGAREAAQAGDLLFGTVDTWLIWNLTQGRVHATDYTNASRTMLFNINTGEWDGWLCELFSIPPAMLPEVRPSSGNFGRTSNDILPGGIPLTGVAGDQQAALFGQCCFAPGEAKSTFGTGCFMLMNIGTEPALSHHGLLTTIAASASGAEGLEYALEGSVFMGGSRKAWALLMIPQAPRRLRKACRTLTASMWCLPSRALALRIGTRTHGERSSASRVVLNGRIWCAPALRRRAIRSTMCCAPWSSTRESSWGSCMLTAA